MIVLIIKNHDNHTITESSNKSKHRRANRVWRTCPSFLPPTPSSSIYIPMRLERHRLLLTATHLPMRMHALFSTALAVAVVILRTSVFTFIKAPAAITAAVVAVAVAAVVAAWLSPLAFCLRGEPLHLCFLVSQHLVGVLQLALEFRR